MQLNVAYVKKSFWNLWSLGDVDAAKPETVVYGDVPDKNDRIKEIIVTYVIPYVEIWDEVSLSKLKDVMQYLLTFDTERIRLLFNAVLPPCEAPDPPSLLLEWMMDALFPGEDHTNVELSDAQLIDDTIEPPVQVDRNAKIPSAWVGEEFVVNLN
jgi:hypothetical protein